MIPPTTAKQTTGATPPPPPKKRETKELNHVANLFNNLMEGNALPETPETQYKPISAPPPKPPFTPTLRDSQKLRQSIARLDPDKLLSIEALNCYTNLSGTSVKEIQFSPDGERVTYLKASKEDPERLDLWCYKPREKKSEILIHSLELSDEEENLPSEEAALRERKRLFATGITCYHWAPDSKALLFPLEGKLYYYDFRQSENPLKRLLPEHQEILDPQFSPSGRYISYVSKKNVHCYDFITGKICALTKDGKNRVSNGLADYIAAEEMHSHLGVWWSLDEKRIAFVQVDENPLPKRKRAYFDGENFVTQVDRYPYAGEANITSKLGIVNIATQEVVWASLGEDPDFYLARVQWWSKKKLLVQRLNREQTQLTLLQVDVLTGESKVIHCEENEKRINLHGDLFPIYKNDRSPTEFFVWISERTGYKHLYLYDTKTTNPEKKFRPLTQGEWSVARVVRVDSMSRTIYYESYEKSPLEKHLYSVSIDIDKPSRKQLTSREGWHEIHMDSHCRQITDWCSTPTSPPQLAFSYLNDLKWDWIEENKVEDGHPYKRYADTHSVPEFGTLEAEDGQTLSYQLTRPIPFEKNRKYPALIHMYGGPGYRLVKKEWGSLWEQHLARMGYVVFSIDNRGSADRGRAFEDKILNQLGEIEVRDQKRGAEFLRSLEFVDRERIHLFGWSYGGYLSLMTLLKCQELFRSAIAVAPVTDWKRYDTFYTERYLGHPSKNPLGYQQSSVLEQVKQTKGLRDRRILLIHGMADDNVMYEHSVKLMHCLQEKGILFEHIPFPKSKHSIPERRARIFLFNKIDAFLKG